MIKDLKELDKFLRICRKQGVTEIAIEGISVKLGEMTGTPDTSSSEDTQSDELTPEQLMFYAVGGAQ